MAGAQGLRVSYEIIQRPAELPRDCPRPTTDSAKSHGHEFLPNDPHRPRLRIRLRPLQSLGQCLARLGGAAEFDERSDDRDEISITQDLELLLRSQGLCRRERSFVQGEGTFGIRPPHRIAQLAVTARQVEARLRSCASRAARRSSMWSGCLGRARPPCRVHSDWAGPPPHTHRRSNSAEHPGSGTRVRTGRARRRPRGFAPIPANQSTRHPGRPLKTLARARRSCNTSISADRFGIGPITVRRRPQIDQRLPGGLQQRHRFRGMSLLQADVAHAAPRPTHVTCESRRPEWNPRANPASGA